MRIQLPSAPDKDELFWLWKQKMADISLVLRVRTRQNNSKKTLQEQQEDNYKGDICYLENMCEAEQT